MATPYLSTRAGSFQWLAQRVSAALLVGLAFTHFAIQHFTSDAVSTGLTVAARLNDPWWQAFYCVFIALALYHGINGVVGILRDYAPPARWRVGAEALLWMLALFFGARGIVNVATPTPLGEVKERYARLGLPAGSSAGNPPNPLGAKSYDFREELRELHLLQHYLAKHTHRNENTPLAEVFAHQPDIAPDPTSVSASGKAFDRWAAREIAKGPIPADLRGPGIFSSTYEFAVWALALRRADARAAGRAEPEIEPTPPPYSAALH